MNEPQRWPRHAWIPIASAVVWLLTTRDAGALSFLLLLPIAALLLASGVAQLLWPGDLRITQTMALAGLLGVLAFVPLALLVGLGAALLLALLSAVCLLTAGHVAVHQEALLEGVPRPEPGPALWAKVAADEVILGLEQFSIGLPLGEAARRLRSEVEEARKLFGERGWLADPASYHVRPPAIDLPRIRSEQSGRIRYEHLTFESLYEPHPDEPGRERWQRHGPTRTAHAYLLRHGAGERPWLICNNGYRTGIAAIDLRAFLHCHTRLGMNVLIPVLPLHGPRRSGRLSGDGFLSGDVLDSIHAEAQAMWDIRRLIGWARAEGASRIGTYGLSLGGYTSALLASLEDGLACAIAGIPVVDFARIFWRHGPGLQLDYLAHVELEQQHAAEILRVVSPLAMAPRVPKPGRMIFGGVADRLVTPDHIRDLARHWDEPRVVWYQGAHLSFPLEPGVRAGIEATLREAKLLA